MTASMVPTVYTGVTPGTGTSIDGSNSRWNTSDSFLAAGDVNCLIRPLAGFNYSFWKHFGLVAATTPVTVANTLVFYSSGVNPDVGILWWGQIANVGAAGGYRQATGTTGITGDALNTTNHTGLTTGQVDVFSWTSSSPLALSGSITNPNTGRWSDFVAMQVSIDTTAASGPITQQTFTYVWDET